MALQVWLPLNGDLHNQGLTNITTTNYGATINDSGKIGKCYSFDGTDDYLQLINFNPSGWAEFSISFWCYPTAALNYVFLIRSGSTHQVRISGDGFTFRDTLNSTQRTTAFGTTIEQNIWTHITCVYNKGEVYIYINGVQTAHRTNYYNVNATLNSDLTEIRFARQQSSSGNTYYTGKLNDIRIYNHALSAKEAEEISKALVLHYKLNSITNNIIYDCSGYRNNGTIIGAYTLDTPSPRYNQGVYMNNTSTANHIESNAEIAIPEDSVSVSFWAKFDKTKSGVIFIDPKIEFAKNTKAAAWLCRTASTAGFTLASFITNEWNHIVAIRDGASSYKLYINGIAVAQNQSANNWRHDTTKLYLLNRNYNNSYAGTGSIVDFRMYATVLTPQQIKELYNTSMIINNGVITPRSLE